MSKTLLSFLRWVAASSAACLAVAGTATQSVLCLSTSSFVIPYLIFDILSVIPTEIPRSPPCHLERSAAESRYLASEYTITTHQLPITSRKHRASPVRRSFSEGGSIENPSHQPTVQRGQKCPLSVLKVRFWPPDLTFRQIGLYLCSQSLGMRGGRGIKNNQWKIINIVTQCKSGAV